MVEERERCSVRGCGKPLSIYNKTGRCWCHQVADPVQKGGVEHQTFCLCSSPVNLRLLQTRMQEYGFSDSWIA